MLVVDDKCLWQDVCLPLFVVQGATASEQGASCCSRRGSCVDARLIQVIFIKSLAVLPYLFWRIKCVVLGFVSGLTENRFRVLGLITHHDELLWFLWGKCYVDELNSMILFP